jgi:hypothetical protein
MSCLIVKLEKMVEEHTSLVISSVTVDHQNHLILFVLFCSFPAAAFSSSSTSC